MLCVLHRSVSPTVDVGDVIFATHPRAQLLHGVLWLRLRLRRPGVTRLLQLPVQHLHEAVGVTVGMDGAGLTFTPTQGYQVVLAIPCVHQVTGVSASTRNILLILFRHNKFGSYYI